MGNKRIVARPTFRRIDLGDGGWQKYIRPQTIDRLGRKSHHGTLPQKMGSLTNIGRIISQP
jgi:hypothetical protein